MSTRVVASSSATRTRSRSQPRPERVSRSCASESRSRSPRPLSRSSCCFPTRRATDCQSFTASRVTSSARIAPRECWCAPGSRPPCHIVSRSLRSMEPLPRMATPTPPEPQLRSGAVELPVRLLSENARLPSRAHDGDAGLDLRAAEGTTIRPGKRASVGTGIAIEIPPGHAGLVLPRSGLAAKHGISLVNAPGLIDSGYRGEIRVLLLNTDREQLRAVVAHLIFDALRTGALWHRQACA